MKTLLVIGYVWPEPRSSAAGSRMLQLLEVFRAAGFRLVFGSPADHSPHAVDLAALDIEAVSLKLNCSSFDDYIRTLQPDVVLFDRFMMEEQFGWRVDEHCPQALRILDSEDLHFLRHARHAELKQRLAAGDVTLPQMPAIEHLYSDMAIREVAAILRCDLTLTISEYEMALLQSHFQVPARQLLYCPFMLPVTDLQALPGFAERQHFVSIGNFRHEPNWDAVRYLKESLWPLIRQQLPAAELHVYGAYPPKKATDLHNPKQGFLVKGWAEDAFAVVRSARVLLAPLRFGAGLKGKLVDAAQCGTPAVTTPIGAEGMYGDDAEPGALVADSPADFAAMAVQLYQDESLWQSLNHHTTGLVARRFAYPEHAARLQERLQTLLHAPEQHRQPLFFNAMLRHHSLKSTRYMAQWIEAKNRLKQQDILLPGN